MKIIRYLFFLLSFATSEALDCSYGQEIVLPGSRGKATLKQVMNPADGTVTIQLVYEGQAWLGVGVTDSSGQMMGGEAVIGLPGEDQSSTNPAKYDLNPAVPAGAIPMPSQKQTLMNASIKQTETQTVLEFTKLLKENGEREILASGSNTFIYAIGSSNELGYHDIRGSFPLELSSCTEVETPAPTNAPFKQTESPTSSPTEPPVKETTSPTASPIAVPAPTAVPTGTPPTQADPAEPEYSDESFDACMNAIIFADADNDNILERSEYASFLYQMSGDEAFQDKAFEQLPVDLQTHFWGWSGPNGVDVSTPNDNHVTHVRLFCRGTEAAIQEAASPESHVFINAGGSAFTANGITWDADAPYVTGGRTYSVGSEQNISGTEDLDVLYRSERNGNSTYNIALENGAYQIRLHFAETYDKITRSGRRMFDVEVQDVLIYEDLDVFDRAGGLYAALVLQNEVSVTDGNLKISFLPGSIQNPMISGIEVHSLFV